MVVSTSGSARTLKSVSVTLKRSRLGPVETSDDTSSGMMRASSPPPMGQSGWSTAAPPPGAHAISPGPAAACSMVSTEGPAAASPATSGTSSPTPVGPAHPARTTAARSAAAARMALHACRPLIHHTIAPVAGRAFRGLRRASSGCRALGPQPYASGEPSGSSAAGESAARFGGGDSAGRPSTSHSSGSAG